MLKKWVISMKKKKFLRIMFFKQYFYFDADNIKF